MNTNSQPIPVVPFSFDLSSLVPRSVASLYSNLVTRPTGRALRVGIETQIAEIGGCCLSVLDFSQVIVLDYSCADEIVAKLVLRYTASDRPADAYFVARGLGEQHCDPIEAVLARHGLLLVAQLHGAGFSLLGQASAIERRTWSALQQLGHADVQQLAASTGASAETAGDVLDSLAFRRAIIRADSSRYLALSALLAR
jgi:hypothetical protein